jgi:hypothetical protein
VLDALCTRATGRVFLHLMPLGTEPTSNCGAAAQDTHVTELPYADKRRRAEDQALSHSLDMTLRGKLRAVFSKRLMKSALLSVPWGEDASMRLSISFHKAFLWHQRRGAWRQGGRPNLGLSFCFEAFSALVALPVSILNDSVILFLAICSAERAEQRALAHLSGSGAIPICLQDPPHNESVFIDCSHDCDGRHPDPSMFLPWLCEAPADTFAGPPKVPSHTCLAVVFTLLGHDAQRQFFVIQISMHILSQIALWPGCPLGAHLVSHLGIVLIDVDLFPGAAVAHPIFAYSHNITNVHIHVRALFFSCMQSAIRNQSQ